MDSADIRTRDRLSIWVLAAANGISQAGNSLTSLAIPWFVLVTTDSASRTGIAGAVAALSPVTAGLFSGPIVDQLGFRRSSIISDALSGITIALVPVLYLLDWLTFTQLLILVFLGAFFDVPGSTARSALIPSLARRAGMPLERANSIIQMSFSLSNSVIAPLLGGFLIAAVGAAYVLFIDAGTFAVSILLIGLLIVTNKRAEPAADGEAEETAEEDTSTVDRLLAGFRFVLRDEVMRTVLPVAVMINSLGAAFGAVLLPVYVREEFDNPAYLGLILSAMGVGVLIGIVLFGIYGSRLTRYNLFLSSFMLMSIAIWLFTLPVYLPTDMLGRVLSALFTLAAIAAPLGVLIAGFSADAFGQRPTMIATSALLTLIPFWVGLAPWPRRAAPAFEE